MFSLTLRCEQEARTVVLDDQGDLYYNLDDVWLTDKRTLALFVG